MRWSPPTRFRVWYARSALPSRVMISASSARTGWWRLSRSRWSDRDASLHCGVGTGSTRQPRARRRAPQWERSHPMSARRTRSLAVVALALAVVLPAAAGTATGQPAPPGALARIPIRAVTIFKDGHAFVLHEGRLPTDAAGNVVMDYLPIPVLGTFWAHSADPKARLTSAVASQQRVRIDRTAPGLRELIEGNIGAQVVISALPGGREQPLTYAATIVGVPERGGEELERTSPPNSGEKLPQKGNVVLLRTEAGT